MTKYCEKMQKDAQLHRVEIILLHDYSLSFFLAIFYIDQCLMKIASKRLRMCDLGHLLRRIFRLSIPQESIIQYCTVTDLPIYQLMLSSRRGLQSQT